MLNYFCKFEIQNITDMKIIKTFGFLVFILFFTLKSFSQIGLDFIGNKNTYKGWNDVLYEKAVKDSEIFSKSYGGGINYWFSLKDFRVEFTPGVYYLYSDFILDETEAGVKYIAHEAGVEFDINIYIFDFIRKSYKRDCPSFSDGSNWLKKSFFLQASPKLFGAQRSLINSDNDIRHLNIGGKFDFGIGLEIPVTRHFVLAPIVKYGFGIGNNWDGFSEYHDEDSFNDGTSHSYLSLVLAMFIK